MRNSRSIWVFILLVALPMPACASSYSAKAIEARIVDAETAQPVAGAVLVAVWVLEYGMEGGQAYYWVVMETQSDQNGRFTFPAWGPKTVPPELPWGARLKKKDPQVWFYKYGYAGLKETSSQAGKDYGRPKDSAFHGPTEREWYLNGETFLYKPANGDLKSLGDELNLFNDWIGYFDGDPCVMLQVPRSLKAIDDAYRTLKAQPGPHQGRGVFGKFESTVYARLTRGDEAAMKQKCGATVRATVEQLERSK